MDLNLDNLLKNVKENKFVKNFIDELEDNLVQKNNANEADKQPTNEMEQSINEGDKFVVFELKDDSSNATLLNASTAERVEVSKAELEKNSSNKLELGDNFIYQNGEFNQYTEEMDIGNRAWGMLEPLYFNLKEEDGRHYEVTDVTEDKIQLCDTKIKAKYTEDRADYPDLQVGDKLVRKNGEYVKE